MSVEQVGLIVTGASVVVFVVWLLAARAVVRHQPEVQAGAATMDLGPESPAVVNHLVHRALTAHAVPATLLDLSARGWVEVFAPHEGKTMVRVRAVRPSTGDALTPYEAQLLDAVAKVAGSADLPVERLASTLHPSSPWFWTQFKMAVSRESRALGLVRRPKVARIALTADIAPFMLAVGLALIDPGLLGLGIPLFIVLWPLAWYLAIRKAPDQLTEKGRAVASHWLGVRAFIDGTGSLDDVPPAAVRVWDRYLAYGAAMDLSDEAVRGLLMEFDTDVGVGDVMEIGRTLVNPATMTGFIGEQMVRAHEDKLREMGPGFSLATPFGPDGGDFCVLAGDLQRGLGTGVPAFGPQLGEWARALARRIDALRDTAPPEIARSVWALHGEIAPVVGKLTNASSMEALGPAMVGSPQLLASPASRQHLSEVTTYLRDTCHLDVDIERFIGP